MSVKYEEIQKALSEDRRELRLISDHTSPAAILRIEQLESNICALEEMADRIESNARDIAQEMGV